MSDPNAFYAAEGVVNGLAACTLAFLYPALAAEYLHLFRPEPIHVFRIDRVSLQVVREEAGEDSPPNPEPPASRAA
jgi:hypothetical protein